MSAELELHFRRLGGRGDVGTNNERSSREDSRHRDCTVTATHDPSRKTPWFRNRPGRYKNRAGRALRREGTMHPAGAFEKRKVFQRVYCSISTPSYI